MATSYTTNNNISVMTLSETNRILWGSNLSEQFLLHYIFLR